MRVIFGILFFVIMAGAAAFAVFTYMKSQKKKGKKTISYIAGAVAVMFLALLIIVPAGIVEVGTGEVAVVKVFGEAKDIKSSGLHFRNIFTTKYEMYDIKTQQMDIHNEVYTKDAQALNIELTVQYSLSADKLLEISRTYGTMLALSQRIEKIAVEKAKVVLSAKTAMSLIETRAAISPDVYNEIKTLEDQYFIRVENVVVVDMAFSAAFEQAVEEKMIAQQEVTKAQAEKEKAIIKAEQDLEVAKLAAEQALAAAKGEADAQVTIAKAEADTLKLKSIEVARMLGFAIKEVTEDITIDILDDEGNKSGEEIITKIVGYEIDFDASGDELEKSLISDYLKYIAYLDTWDGKLPSVITGDEGSIFIPIP